MTVERNLFLALSDINQLLHSTLDIDDVLRRLVGGGAAALGCESAGISLRDVDGWTVRTVHNLPEAIVGSRMTDSQERHAVLAIETGKPVEVADGFNDPRFNVEHLRRHNIRAVLVVPLMMRGEAFGALFLNYHSGPHAFSDSEIAFAAQLATTASIALEHARLFAEITRAATDARQRATELEYFNEMMVGRELRVIELKNEVDDLCRQLGQPSRYRLTAD